MAQLNKKYIFDKETLQYQVVKVTPVHRLKKVLAFVFIPLFIFLITVLVSIYYSATPKYLTLLNHKDKLNQQLTYLNYKVDSLVFLLHQTNFNNDNNYRALLEIDSLAGTIRQAGFGGVVLPTLITHVRNNHPLLAEVAAKISSLQHQVEIQSFSFNEIESALRERDLRLASVPMVLPINTKDIQGVSSHFGGRIDPLSHLFSQHNGIDFIAPPGTNVYATGNGIVTLSNYSRNGYGNEVVINHSFGFSTRYAHLHEILINEGDTVKRGKLIGLVGSTGKSTGPHLHYEVRFLNKPLNPVYYYAENITGVEYEKMVRKISENKIKH